MDFPLKTISQIRPVVMGFRKSAGLTQASMATRLGITQQSYAEFEANPASASVDRLFRVLRLLDVELTLTAAGDGPGGGNATPREAKAGARAPRATAVKKALKPAAATARGTAAKPVKQTKQVKEAVPMKQAKPAKQTKQTKQTKPRSSTSAARKPEIW